MPSPYIPPPDPEPVWPKADEVADLIAVFVLFLMIGLVGWASCWEIVQ